MLFKLEILIFLLSFGYICYYVGQKFFGAYFKVKKAIKKDEIIIPKTKKTKVDLHQEKKYESEIVKKKLTDDEQVHISEILKRVKINATKGYFDTAKTLIVEGLSIDKLNKDLNLELANIYEKEKKYENAEYIYNDLLEVFSGDINIKKKLAYIYALQNKLDKSMETYEKVHKKNVGDDEVIDMLSEIAYDVKDYKKAIKYLTMFLKSNPRNVDKMTMKAISLESLKKYKDAYTIHKKILELQPYNTFSRDKVREFEGYM